MPEPNINKRKIVKTWSHKFLKASEDIFQVMGDNHSPGVADDRLYDGGPTARAFVIANRRPKPDEFHCRGRSESRLTATGIIDNLVKKNWFPAARTPRPPWSFAYYHRKGKK